MKILKKFLSESDNTKLSDTDNFCKEPAIQEEKDTLLYGSSVILKKYPAIGGTISSVGFHCKDQKQTYHIHINGKSKTKRYTKDDFILDLKGSWGYYPWFPEDGDHFISPDDLKEFKKLVPYGKIFQCMNDNGKYVTLKHKKMTFKVRRSLYKIINKPELIKNKYDFPFTFDEIKMSKISPVNLWGHYLGDKNAVFKEFSLIEPYEINTSFENGGIFQCIEEEKDSLILKYDKYTFKTKPELFRLIPAPLFHGDIVILRNNPAITGIVTDMYWNYVCREYIYILTINGKRKTQKFLTEDFLLR